MTSAPPIASALMSCLTAISARAARLPGRRSLAAELGEDLGPVPALDARIAEARHRVGNNLSVILAMLNIQARHLDDPPARRAIEMAAERVRAIAEINDYLDRSGSTNVRIDDSFVAEFAAKRIEAAGAGHRVGLETAIEPIELPKLMLTPLALIINECVFNALQHGFAGDAQGAIEIRLETRRERHHSRRLTISDNRIGLPANSDPKTPAGAGLAFVKAFALQLDGAFCLERSENGARAVLTF
jgi:two-component sensor histidine kinase